MPVTVGRECLAVFTMDHVLSVLIGGNAHEVEDLPGHYKGAVNPVVSA